MRTLEARSAAAKRAAQTRRTLSDMKTGPTVAEIVTERAAARESLRTALTVALRVLDTQRENDSAYNDEIHTAYWTDDVRGDGAVALRLVRAELEKIK